MTLELLAPSATAPSESHADWLELRALLADDRNSSLTDLVRAIRPTGTIEAVIDEQLGNENASPAELSDPGDDMSETVADSASSELDDRELACGGAYPFTRGPQHLQALPEAVRSVYVFLLLLSTDGVLSSPDGLSAPELFEDIATVAAGSFFGGSADHVHVYQFGFPRRRTLKGFKPAIDDLCTQLGEGGAARDRPNQRHQKDAKLDIVVWRSFPDGRTGKLVAFGQCAAGADWTTKVSELQPRAFTNSWMSEPLGIEPTRMFFCPFRVERDTWPTTVMASGLLFDRCRIAHHCSDLSDELLDKCQQFSSHVLAQREAIARA
ncbi:MAG TPA: hypothetical protein VGL79_02340 [Solirubrobacteraceae bacterium]|jgi:hypothetical protein